MPDFEQLLGPLGLTVALIAFATFLGRAAWRFCNDLWTEHKASDQRERDARLAAETRLDTALAGLKEHTVVTDKAVALAQQVVEEIRRGRTG